MVTGGGGGIGAAIASELGRRGDLVVTVDPLVSLDGSERLPDPRETTAGRIVAAGGAALASDVSVTDRSTVEGLFADLVAEHGRLDAVVNVAGITRPTTFARGREDDWRAVLDVHLEGYLNVLRAALPIMGAAGRGRVLGVTSGSGWRSADAGAYGCAKRAVAALTWQIGRAAPPGVTVAAMSPIAVTRMVTEALARAAGRSGRRGSATGGLSLGSMPEPAALGPLGAHLVGEAVDWCQGQVVFAAGSEVALVEPPRLIEVVRTAGVSSVAHLLEAATPTVLAPAEAAQASTGGSNPRLSGALTRSGGSPSEEGSDRGADPTSSGVDDLPPPAVARCLVVSDRPEVDGAVAAALEARGVVSVTVPGSGARGSTSGSSGEHDITQTTFAEAARILDDVQLTNGPVDAVVVVPADGPVAPEAEDGSGSETGATGGRDTHDPAAGSGSSTGAPSDTEGAGWERVLAEHEGLVDDLVSDAAWSRSVADAARAGDRPMRLVTLVDARTARGRSRAQAAAQLARAAWKGTGQKVASFAVASEGSAAEPAVELATHLVTSMEAVTLSGAELVVGDGWCGLRSHPRPGTGVVVGGPDLPDWFDEVMSALVEVR